MGVMREVQGKGVLPLGSLLEGVKVVLCLLPPQQ